MIKNIIGASMSKPPPYVMENNYIRVDNDEGEEELILWTLETYIKLSNIKYASKAHTHISTFGIYSSHGSRENVWRNKNTN